MRKKRQKFLYWSVHYSLYTFSFVALHPRIDRQSYIQRNRVLEFCVEVFCHFIRIKNGVFSWIIYWAE